MNATPSKDLQQEAESIQYSLRSAFFFRRRQQFRNLAEEIGKLEPSHYRWDSLKNLGISRSSWEYVANKGILPTRVFCHPEVISDNPRLIAYYRLLAVLPQKGVQRLAFGVKNLEEGRGRKLPLERAQRLSEVLNTYISSLIDETPTFSIDDALLVAQMNLGAQVNGSWRNEIGAEGSRRVKELVLTYFLGRGLVNLIMAKDGSRVTPSPPPPLADEIQGFVAMNGYQVIFGSEPDVSIINPQGVLEAAIEVKAGIDPAGALERYGAAKKSFDRVLKENKAATTIYLASCVTEGVRKVIADDRLAREDFNLTNILLDEHAKERFFNYICWLMHLSGA